MTDRNARARAAVMAALLAAAALLGVTGCHPQTCRHHPERCYVHTQPVEENP